MRDVLHRIGEDLDAHAWYEQVVRETIDDVQAFAARRAAFEEYADSLEREAADDRA